MSPATGGTFSERVRAMHRREARLFSCPYVGEHDRPWPATTAPVPLVHFRAEPVPLEHAEHCEGQRVESSSHTGGLRVTRCLDCQATASAAS